MSVAPIRPRLVLRPAMGVNEALQRVRGAFEEREPYTCTVLGNHVDLSVERAERRVWSPCLHLEIGRDEASGETVVHGVIGPHPNVWTLYAVVMLHMVIVVFFALPFGLVQMTLDQTPWALWVALGGVVGGAGMYALSQAGRRLSRAETEELDRLIRGALGVD